VEVFLGSQALRTVVQRWKWMLVGAIATVSVVAIVLMLQPPSYASTVNIVPMRARTEVDYDTRIRTISSDGAAPTQGSTSLPSASVERRQALAQLVRSAEIEQEVRSRLGDSLPVALRSPGRLGKLVQAHVLPRSEVIAIEVEAPSAVLAEQIAKEWSQVYEQRVNSLYGSSATRTPQLDGELEEAQKKYQAAEDTLTNFVATESVEETSRQLEANQRLLRELITVRQTEVVDLYKMAHRVELLITQAEALQQQLVDSQDESAAASSAVALSLLKTQAFASSMSLPAGLQLQLPSDTTASQLGRGGAQQSTTGASAAGAMAANEQPQDAAAISRALQDWTLPGNLQVQLPLPATSASIAQLRSDVAATIKALQDWHQRLDDTIQQRSVEGVAEGPMGQSHISQTIERLEGEARTLKGRASAQQARQRALEQERDVLWDSYSTVLKKAEENRVAGLVGTGKEIGIAGQSLAEPKSRRLGLFLPLAALVGAGTAAAVALIVGYLSPMYGDLLGRSDSRHQHDAHRPALTRRSEESGALSS
jgi:capsular polysaccharide biosynthesis protein